MVKKRMVCRRCAQNPIWVNRKGFCAQCAALRHVESIDALRNRQGLFYKKWKEEYRQGVKRYLERLKQEEEG